MSSLFYGHKGRRGTGYLKEDMNVNCPYCHYQNIAGEDRCQQCFHSLMHQNLPQPQKDDSFQSVMMTCPVTNLLTGKDLLVASPSDSVQKVTKIFQKEKKDCVLVYKRKKLVGILVVRDLLWKVAGKYRDLSKVKVEDVMTTRIETMKPEDPIAFVVNKMALGGFRHLPVLNPDGTPISVVIIKDVLKYLSKRRK